MTTDVRRGEIYLVDLNNRVGSEQSGIRPAVIVQNNTGNTFSPTTMICPLTSRDKQGEVTHVLLTRDDAGIVKDSIVLCEQLVTIDKSRLMKKLGEIKNKSKILDINTKMLVSLGIQVEGV